jgi:hypothetical protein
LGGGTVVCIASGPSLCNVDVAAVKRWRFGSGSGAGKAKAGTAPEGRRVIVTNTSFRIAPWADALFAMDEAWWRKYRAELSASDFAGERWSCDEVAGANQIDRAAIKNSGAGAIIAAVRWGAARVILLGYDAQKTGGAAHWHGDHPPGLGNAGCVGQWPAQFEKVAAFIAPAGVKVLNASRATALTCFPRVDLSGALHELR